MEHAFRSAHREGDVARLALLFAEASRRAPDGDAERFMLTQAHALARDAGLAQADEWRRRWVVLGAEAPERRTGTPQRQPAAQSPDP